MRWLIIFSVCSVAFLSCKKEKFTSDSNAKIQLSKDTLRFDTVFTTIGSITQSLRIINPNKDGLHLSSIQLMGGAASAYSINVNGIAGPSVQNVDVLGEDSIHLFVSVRINPAATNLPFIVRDSIRVTYNGNVKFIQLEAFGQNAIFLRKQKIRTNTTFTNTLPYVLLDGFTVDTNAVLTLNAGTKIYSSTNNIITVHGSLIANGSKAEPIIFRGNRLDEPYNSLPASWPGIYFSPVSKNNSLVFCKVLNAYQALVADGASVNAQPKLFMQQCIVDNAYESALWCAGSSVQANNSLFSNSKQNLLVQFGGNYSFTNCSFAAYSNRYVFHSDPSNLIYNYGDANGSTVSAPLDATFSNCIFWGDANTEIAAYKQGTQAYNVLLRKCIYKSAANPANLTFLGSIQNQDPMFDSVDMRMGYYDFRISKPVAPGINAGEASPFSKDLDDKPRAVGITDIGCYEKQ